MVKCTILSYFEEKRYINIYYYYYLHMVENLNAKSIHSHPENQELLCELFTYDKRLFTIRKYVYHI